MKTCAIAFLVFLTMLSCEKDDAIRIGSLDGTYEGVFFRASPQASYQTSKVTLVFEGNTFEGSSSIMKYPAICRGTYTLTGDKIEFANLCAWTAEFDWSYILSGKFKITRDGNEIVISRSYDDELTHDTYKLIQ